MCAIDTQQKPEGSRQSFFFPLFFFFFLSALVLSFLLLSLLNVFLRLHHCKRDREREKRRLEVTLLLLFWIASILPTFSQREQRKGTSKKVYIRFGTDLFSLSLSPSVSRVISLSLLCLRRQRQESSRLHLRCSLVASLGTNFAFSLFSPRWCSSYRETSLDAKIFFFSSLFLSLDLFRPSIQVYVQLAG